MNFEEKIDFLDSLVGGTLSFTHFCCWELSSYESDSLFVVDGSIGHVFASTITKCVNEAIRAVKGGIANV